MGMITIIPITMRSLMATSTKITTGKTICSTDTNKFKENSNKNMSILDITFRQSFSLNGPLGQFNLKVAMSTYGRHIMML